MTRTERNLRHEEGFNVGHENDNTEVPDGTSFLETEAQIHMPAGSFGGQTLRRGTGFHEQGFNQLKEIINFLKSGSATAGAFREAADLFKDVGFTREFLLASGTAGQSLTESATHLMNVFTAGGYEPPQSVRTILDASAQALGVPARNPTFQERAHQESMRLQAEMARQQEQGLVDSKIMRSIGSVDEATEINSDNIWRNILGKVQMPNVRYLPQQLPREANNGFLGNQRSVHPV